MPTPPDPTSPDPAAGSRAGAPRPAAAGPPASTTGRPARVVVLASGAGSNLAALLDAQRAGGSAARVVGVVSDVASAGALDLARQAGVATAVVAPRDFADRSSWDAALAQAVGVFDPAWVVCAGFMRILGSPFLSRFEGRVLNTHPALLPAFPGAHAVRDALAHGVRVTGCTVHLVDAGVDTGPILAQRAVEIDEDDGEESLHERIKLVERRLLVEVVDRVVRSGIVVDGRRARLG
ncbi:phosphoribosylglycinamide formyltransferase [Actinotalea sp.]|uniref:phosphoribosylglycinamide formyltransferase n=1 Tax=Actinotalea sp. TaxID=1872145 RepID=UPI003563F0DF